jgi:hypothetical protein
MTPKAKEKANELVERFRNFVDTDFEDDHLPIFECQKQCALIAVDEILKAIDWHEFEQPNKEYEYWNEVKQEIEKL